MKFISVCWVSCVELGTVGLVVTVGLGFTVRLGITADGADVIFAVSISVDIVELSWLARLEGVCVARLTFVLLAHPV